MRDVDIEPSISVDIRGIDPHACFIAAIFAGGDAGKQRDILERSVVFVNEEEIGPGIVGYGDVRPAIVIEVSQNQSHAFRFRLANARSIAHISEGTVMVVVEELGLLAMVVSGMTIGAVAGAVLSTPDVGFGGPLNVVGND